MAEGAARGRARTEERDRGTTDRWWPDDRRSRSDDIEVVEDGLDIDPELEVPAADVDPADPDERARGRAADRPAEIPASGWRDVLRRVQRELRDDDVSLTAAGVAFYALLSLVPAMVAAVSVYGLVASPEDVSRQVGELSSTMPDAARQVVTDQLTQVTSTSRAGLSFGLIGGVALALWSASAAMTALMRALSRVFDEHEDRGLVKLRGQAVLLTAIGIVFAVVVIGLLAAVPALTSRAGWDALGTVLDVARWPLLFVVLVLSLAALYRYAPDRQHQRWGWATWGSTVGAVVWLAASALFSLYASRFGSYDKTYGSLAGVVVLMLWLYLSAFCVLLGAEVDAELEHQTARDTTTGPPAPPGERGAHVADTVGTSP
ncbi:MAG: YihY/virulence factor BrkB family protein [Acidimicrobiales bacterium]